jgi:hypothetical protein
MLPCALSPIIDSHYLKVVRNNLKVSLCYNKETSHAKICTYIYDLIPYQILHPNYNGSLVISVRQKGKCRFCSLFPTNKIKQFCF